MFPKVFSGAYLMVLYGQGLIVRPKSGLISDWGDAISSDCWLCVSRMNVCGWPFFFRFYFGFLTVFFGDGRKFRHIDITHVLRVCLCVFVSSFFLSVYLGSGEWRVCFCLFRRHRMIWHLALFGLFKGIQHALFGCCFLLVDFLNSVLSVTVSVVLNMWLRVVSQVSLVFV